MRPLARSNLPFDSPMPSPSLPPSPRLPSTAWNPRAISSPRARRHAARVVDPPAEQRPVSLSASVLLGGTSAVRNGGERDNVEHRSLDEHAVGDLEVLTRSPATGDDVSLRSLRMPLGGVGVGEPVQRTSREYHYSTYTSKCLDELRLAKEGNVLAWMDGLDACSSAPDARGPDRPSQRHDSDLVPPQLHPLQSDTLPPSFRHLEEPMVSSDTRITDLNSAQSSRSHGLFGPLHWWRRRLAPRPSSLPAPLPEPPTPSIDTCADQTAASSDTARTVRFAPSSTLSFSYSRSRSPSPPPADWHLVSPRALADRNAQGQLAPREPGAWARWVGPRPAVRAWRRGAVGRDKRESVGCAVRDGLRATREDDEGDGWAQGVRFELERAARGAAQEWEDDALKVAPG